MVDNCINILILMVVKIIIHSAFLNTSVTNKFDQLLTIKIEWYK